jgi:hypothetical protein
VEKSVKERGGKRVKKKESEKKKKDKVYNVNSKYANSL